MLDWHSCQICYSLEIKILLLLLLLSISAVNHCWNKQFSLANSMIFFSLSFCSNATVNTVYNYCVFETFQTPFSLGQI